MVSKWKRIFCNMNILCLYLVAFFYIKHNFYQIFLQRITISKSYKYSRSVTKEKKCVLIHAAVGHLSWWPGENRVRGGAGVHEGCLTPGPHSFISPSRSEYRWGNWGLARKELCPRLHRESVPVGTRIQVAGALKIWTKTKTLINRELAIILKDTEKKKPRKIQRK